MTTEPLTPDVVRALIADADGYAGLDEYPGAVLIRDLAAALSALLPREDADLDAIEVQVVKKLRRAALDAAIDWDDSLARVFGEAADALDALLARVRTAEAERDEVQRRLGVIADSAQDGLADCDDDHDMSAYWVLMVATGQDEENAKPRPHASQSTPVHCPSCDGYQTAVMDDGQRSVGVCEGVEARTVETAERLTADEWRDRFTAVAEFEAAEQRGPHGEVEVESYFTITRDELYALAPVAVETAEEWEPIRAALARRAEMVTPGLDMSVIEEIRRALPPTSEEAATARECGNDGHHGYGTGYCGDCTKEAGHA